VPPPRAGSSAQAVVAPVVISAPFTPSEGSDRYWEVPKSERSFTSLPANEQDGGDKVVEEHEEEQHADAATSTEAGEAGNGQEAVGAQLSHEQSNLEEPSFVTTTSDGAPGAAEDGATDQEQDEGDVTMDEEEDVEQAMHMAEGGIVQVIPDTPDRPAVQATEPCDCYERVWGPREEVSHPGEQRLPQLGG
jgi:hypothetical protein